jgi:hypothetical protein
LPTVNESCRRNTFLPKSSSVLSSNLDFSQALDLLSEYAIRLEGKPLYDPTARPDYRHRYQHSAVGKGVAGRF